MLKKLLLLSIIFFINIHSQEEFNFNKRLLNKSRYILGNNLVKDIEVLTPVKDTLKTNWIKLNGPHGGIISGLVAKGDTVIAGTYMHGNIFYSTDKGENWNKADFKTADRVTDFVFLNDGSVIAAASYSGLYKSYDLKNWVHFRKGYNFWSLGKDFKGGIYAGVFSGSMQYTSDNGKYWSEQGGFGEVWNIITTRNNTVMSSGNSSVFRKDSSKRNFDKIDFSSFILNINMMVCIKDTSIFAIAANRPICLESKDDGLTWTNHDTTGFLRELYSYDATSINGKILVCGSPDPFLTGWGIAISSDDGYTWKYSNKGFFYKTSITELDAANGVVYAGLWPGGVYKSTNSGESWTNSNNGLNAAWTCQAKFNSAGDLFVATGGNGMLKSTDKGNSWVEINNGITYNEMVGLSIDDSDYVYAGGTGGIYVSYDKGNSWITGTSESCLEVLVDDDNNIYGAIRSGIMESSDRGRSWSKVFNQNFIFSLAHDKNDNIYAGGDNGYIYKSTDHGKTWLTIRNNYNTACVVTAITICPNGNIYAANSWDGILKSTNGGSTWENVLPMSGQGFVASSSKGDLYASDFKKGFYFSDDNGNTWHDITGSLKNTTVWYILFDKDDNLYLSTDESMWKGDKVVSVKDETKSNVIANYSLSQNYPNPFNPSTTIKYSIPERDKVSIKIYDVLGKEIKTLLNEEVPAGEHTVQFNANNLPSGIYFYRIQTGSHLETKKMILLK